jgi:TRAP-type C4-dicarboxylate transport system permease small subunit
MEFAVAGLPRPARRVADLLRIAVILGFLAVVVYSGSNLVLSQFRFSTSSSLLDMPVWLFSIFLPFGCALLAFRTVFPPRRAHQQPEASL